MIRVDPTISMVYRFLFGRWATSSFVGGPSTKESRWPNDKSRARVQKYDTNIRGNSLSKNANKNTAAIGPAVWSERLTSNHYLRVGVTSGGSEMADPGSVLWFNPLVRRSKSKLETPTIVSDFRSLSWSSAGRIGGGESVWSTEKGAENGMKREEREQGWWEKGDAVSEVKERWICSLDRKKLGWRGVNGGV